MIGDVIKYIAAKIHKSSPYFNRLDINCIRTQDNRIVEDFQRGFSEMEEIGISDLYSIGCYIRSTGKVDYFYPTGQKVSSNIKPIGLSVGERLVAYSLGKDLFDLYKIEEQLRNNIMSLNFFDYTGKESRIEIKFKLAIIDTALVIKEETGLAKFGEEASIIAIDFTIDFITQPCQDMQGCDVFVT